MNTIENNHLIMSENTGQHAIIIKMKKNFMEVFFIPSHPSHQSYEGKIYNKEKNDYIIKNPKDFHVFQNIKKHLSGEKITEKNEKKLEEINNLLELFANCESKYNNQFTKEELKNL